MAALVGEEYEFPGLLGIKERARETCEEAGSPESFDGCVVFLSHQGYIFYFIGPAGSGVYEISEDGEPAYRCAESFAEFLVGVLEQD
ncbi:hypothetical protein [Kitasatospora fiedleri]|nr:hypothetical protein [Kitasatospora fiedleri]